MVSTTGRIADSDAAAQQGNGHDALDASAEGALALPAPSTIADTDLSREMLEGLALKLAYGVPRFSTDWMVDQSRLSRPVVTELLEDLRRDHLLEVLGQSGPFGFTFSITERGRAQAVRYFEICGYAGPAPVSLRAYREVLEQQLQNMPPVQPADVAQSLAPLVLDARVLEVAGLAARGWRSLFLCGPPGNGKTTLGHLLHEASRGSLWIPYAIAVGQNVIRVFDQECHQELRGESRPAVFRSDRRWLQVRRPFVVVGGELTMQSLDLRYIPNQRFYEAPLHFKANGGTFLLDDFGCQQVAPSEILNRWIHPLERYVDFLTLQSGQQIEVPFRQMLVVSTNLDPNSIMTPAFLRRMGYRIELTDPDERQYGDIFRRYAASHQLQGAEASLEWLLEQYRARGRRMSCCEPRDLIERAREICQYRGDSERLAPDILELAWRGYFGD